MRCAAGKFSMDVSREVPLGHAARADATADATSRVCGGRHSGTHVRAADDCESRSGGFREPHAAVRGFKARGCEGSHEREMHAPREGW